MSGPTVFITGCSEGGIGDAIARQFAARGYRVFASVRDQRKATHFSDDAAITVVSLDVTSPESVKQAASDMNERLPSGKLDVLVNNAGSGYSGPLLEADIATAKKIYDVNIWGLLAMTQAFALMLIAAQGKVVNISSVGGILSIPWGGTYSDHHFSFQFLSTFSLIIYHQVPRC